MKALKETTVWDVPCTNHIYFTTDDKEKIIGMLRLGHKVVKFKNPIRWDRRGRTFKEIKL